MQLLLVLTRLAAYLLESGMAKSKQTSILTNEIRIKAKYTEGLANEPMLDVPAAAPEAEPGA